MVDSARAGAIALRQLEASFDRWTSRFTQPLLLALHARTLGKQPRSAGGRDAAQPLIAALVAAVRSGDWSSAEALIDRLGPMISSLPAAQLAQLRACELDRLISHGRRREATTFSRENHQELSATPYGATLLTLLGERARAWLPDGEPDLLWLSRSIESRQLDAAELAALLANHRFRWQRAPEVLLLFWSALWPQEPRRALGFLNRFLRQSGAPEVLSAPSPEQDNVLCQLANSRFAPRRAGPLVSIIVAAYNAEKTLAYALDSLLSQTHQSFEILLGDDGSEDRTLDVMLRYASEGRVRLFRSARNQGAYNLRNALAARARSDLLTFHDADDLALATRIELQARSLHRARVVGCVTSWLRMRPAGDVVFFKNQKATRLSRVSLMVRRDVFEAVGRFRSARFGADEELQRRIVWRFGDAAIARIKPPLTLSSWSESSVTRRPGSEALEDGYRSPARRAYAELILRKYVAGATVPDESIDEQLRETGNYVEPQELLEIGKR